MLFKNATVVRITGDIPVTVEAIENALTPHKFVPARDMESERYGWVSPTDNEEDPLVRAQGNIFLLCLKIQTKILPASVIKEELKERLAARGLNGRKIRAKERQQMIDEIRFDLLPKAFSKYSRIIGYIDAQRREIVIGTASGNQADEFLSSLRTAFGSLPVALLEPYVSAQLTMTQWAKNRQGPKRVQFGQEISLVDPAEGDKGTFRKQDLSSDEILQCIESGKRVERISLRWNDYLSFSIDEHLVLRKIAALDMFDEEFEGDDDENARLDADLFMTYSGLRRLLPELYQWFQVPDLEYDFGPGESTDEPEGDDDFSLPAMSDADDYQYEHPEQEEDEALVAANEE